MYLVQFCLIFPYALFSAVREVNAFHIETKYACAFIDSINITGDYARGKFNISEYVHNGMTIPAKLVAYYDFIIDKNGVRVPAERHLRACICKVKPCVRFCCASGYYYDLKQRLCSREMFEAINATLDENSMDIEYTNGTVGSVRTAAHFIVDIDTPCDHMRTITKGNGIIHWTLYANGTVAHHNHIFSKHYCFTPLLEDVGPNDTTWKWQPLACAPEKLPFILGVREWTYAICLIIAVICMIIILFVYLFCTEMRNTFYGVAIKAYTLCIIIGYSLLAHLTLNNPATMSKFACGNIPCYTLLYLVLSFYILCFISFNFYLNFHGVILTKLMFWLIFFPIVLIAVGWSVFVAYSHYGGKTIFGGDNCWFDPRNWSIMVYFYAPIFFACVFSFFLYILTRIRISEQTSMEANKSSASLELNRFNSFWKFFGYTTITWLVCMSSFVFNYYHNEKTHLNYAVCLFIAFHGFGALYALIGKNQQLQNFLRRIEDNVDDDDDDEICDNSVPMTNY